MRISMKMPQRIVLSFLVCVLALGVFGSPNATWSRQDPAAYLTDTVPEQFNLVGLDPRTDRNKMTQVRTARGDFESKVTAALGSANALSGADQPTVLNWVGQVLMAEMTTLNPDAQAKLGDLRQDFFRKIVRATSDNNRAYLLNSVILPKAVDIASKNYHPAARVNAVIIMGLLDSQEGISGQRPPKPHLAALRELLKIVDDPQSPDFLVAASLSGLQRHAEIDGQLPARDRMQPAVRTMMVDSMLRLIAKYDANQTEDQPGYLLSRRAVQTLDGLSLPAADPKTAEVKAALTKVATKMKAGKWLRLDAFLALSRLPIDDPKVYLENLGQLVVYVAKDSRARVLLAQKMVKIDQLIKEKTGFAQAKKKSTSQRQRTGPMIGSGGGESMRVGDGDGMPGGMGGGMGGMDGMGDFTEDGLFPFHLHYARTDVKIVVAGTRSILGTAEKAPTGLKAAFADKPETVKLIDQLEKELKALLAVTDIGFVEEKPLTESQKRTMNPNDLFLREQSNSVRVLAGMGRSAESLEKIVGMVELPKTETVEPAVAATPTTPVSVASPTNPPPAGESAATTAEDNGAESTEGTQGSTSGEAGATTGGEGNGGR
ncbi:MAG: hypothetical protein Q8M16_20950 [Pirellulaceae bacterium]|nr:hypothetical protein [Pirellulaceae bacterium]